jgi:hypothetical protein
MCRAAAVARRVWWSGALSKKVLIVVVLANAAAPFVGIGLFMMVHGF